MADPAGPLTIKLDCSTLQLLQDRLVFRHTTGHLWKRFTPQETIALLALIDNTHAIGADEQERYAEGCSVLMRQTSLYRNVSFRCCVTTKSGGEPSFVLTMEQVGQIADQLRRYYGTLRFDAFLEEYHGFDEQRRLQSITAAARRSLQEEQHEQERAAFNE